MPRRRTRSKEQKMNGTKGTGVPVSAQVPIVPVPKPPHDGMELLRATSLDESFRRKFRTRKKPPHSSRPVHALLWSQTRSYTSPNLHKEPDAGQEKNGSENDNEKMKWLERKAMSLNEEYESDDQEEDPVDVFLGGSCNPTTWRRDTAMPMFAVADVKYFNPQVDEWFEELIKIETRAKETAKIVMMVIDNLTRSIVCINEAVEYICRGRLVVLVIEDILPGTMVEGAVLSDTEIADLNGARHCLRVLAMKKKVPVYDNVESAVKGTVRWLRDENVKTMTASRPRLRKRSSIILNEWSGQFRARGNLPRSCSSSSVLSFVSGGSGSESEGSDGSNPQSYVKHVGNASFGLRHGFVYLGGNIHTTWREHVAIPMLQKAGVPFYIPLQDYLSIELQRLSGELPLSNSDRWVEVGTEKSDAELILFVIPGNARSIAAMTEAVELVCSHYAILLVIEPLLEGALVEDGSHVTGREYKDLTRARAYLKEMAERNDIHVFTSVQQAVEDIVGHLKGVV